MYLVIYVFKRLNMFVKFNCINQGRTFITIVIDRVRKFDYIDELHINYKLTQF